MKILERKRMRKEYRREESPFISIREGMTNRKRDFLVWILRPPCSIPKPFDTLDIYIYLVV